MAQPGDIFKQSMSAVTIRVLLFVAILFRISPYSRSRNRTLMKMKYFVLMLLAAVSTLLFYQSRREVRAGNQTVVRPTPTPTRVSDKTQWVAPTVFGLKLGSSRDRDIRKLLGKPWSEGPNDEKTYGNDPEEEILLQYNNVGEFKDAVDFVVGKKSRILKALAVYPLQRRTKQEIISEFGSKFFEIESWESMCISGERQRTEDKKKPLYPILLVYPSKGMYVMLDEDQRVNHTGYGMKCIYK